MLCDSAEELSSLACARYLFLDPPAGGNGMEEAPFASFVHFPQRGKDLGEKMWNAAATAFRLGAMRVVLVGGDCPALSALRVRQAFRELREGAKAVFGPSLDGGYYLVGLGCPDDRLFRNIPWSTPAVLADTVARCRGLSIPFSFLPPETDVDTFEDLTTQWEWTKAHSRPECPRTREWVTAFFVSGGDGLGGTRDRTPGSPRGPRSRREG
jgi:rSAM/selenodomain-associated transferase 1